MLRLRDNELYVIFLFSMRLDVILLFALLSIKKPFYFLIYPTEILSFFPSTSKTCFQTSSVGHRTVASLKHFTGP